jgi:hypothetical protein
MKIRHIQINIDTNIHTHHSMSYHLMAYITITIATREIPTGHFLVWTSCWRDCRAS